MKVLVVEDEPLIRLGMATAVEDAGYGVIEAVNADDALKKLEADLAVQLVLTDVDMPGSMDGLRLAHVVHHRWPAIRVLVVSGKVGVRDQELPHGARFLSKPFEEHRLIGVVQALLAEGDRTS